MLCSVLSSRLMRIGDDVRVSTPVSTASCIAETLDLLVKRRQRFADRRDCT
jgi:hypothetical protein